MIAVEMPPTLKNSTGDFHHHLIIGVVYITFSTITVFINFLVFLIIVRSRRMRTSPKYWLVLAIACLLTLQAAVPNSIMSAVWISRAFPVNCDIWSGAVIYSNFIGIAMVTFTVFLTFLDFLLCLISTSYAYVHRGKIMISLMFISYTIILSTIIPLSIFYGKTKNDTENSCEFHMDTSDFQYGLTWMVLFVPLILSAACAVAISICRANRSVQRLVGMNTDILCDTMDDEVSTILPPVDHLAFLFLEIVLYLPLAVANYGGMTYNYNDHRVLFTFLLGCSVLSDNAGALLPVSWFFFRDMRTELKKLFKKAPSHTPRSLSESPELQVFDNYPYCVMTSG